MTWKPGGRWRRAQTQPVHDILSNDNKITLLIEKATLFINQKQLVVDESLAADLMPLTQKTTKMAVRELQYVTVEANNTREVCK